MMGNFAGMRHFEASPHVGEPCMLWEDGLKTTAQRGRNIQRSSRGQPKPCEGGFLPPEFFFFLRGAAKICPKALPKNSDAPPPIRLKFVT